MPVLMISSVLHSPNMLSVSTRTHTPKHTHTHTTPEETTDLGHFLCWKRRRVLLFISTRWRRSRLVRGSDSLAHTFSLSLLGCDREGRPQPPHPSMWGRIGGGRAMKIFAVRAAHVSTAAPGSLRRAAKHWLENDYQTPRRRQEKRRQKKKKKDSKKRNNCQLWLWVLFITYAQRPV